MLSPEVVQMRLMSATEARNHTRNSDMHPNASHSSRSLSKIPVADYTLVLPSKSKQLAKSSTMKLNNSKLRSPNQDQQASFSNIVLLSEFVPQNSNKPPLYPQNEVSQSNSSHSYRPHPSSKTRTNIPIKSSKKSQSTGSVNINVAKPPTPLPVIEVDIESPLNSTFRKSPVRSFGVAKERIKNLQAKTQIVLTPRFGPDDLGKSSESELLQIPNPEDNKVDLIYRSSPCQVWSRPSNISNSSANTNNSEEGSDLFSPEKSLWVQQAIERLLSVGTVTLDVVNIPGFKKKIGDVYDIVVDKRYNLLSNCVNGVLQTSPDAKCPADSKKFPKKSRTNGKEREGGEGDGDHLQNKVSDILLHILLKNMMMPAMTSTEGCGFKLSSVNLKNASTNTANDSDTDDTSEGDDNEDKSNRRSGQGSRHTFKYNNYETPRQAKNCFVFEGKPYAVESEDKRICSFASLSESRRKTNPEVTGYFRRVVDFRGFDVEEISIKYSKTKIFVGGKQYRKEDRSYRLVKEIIALPRGLEIHDLKIMRGRNKGRLVFEEVKCAKSSISKKDI